MRGRKPAIPREVTVEMWLFLIAFASSTWLFQTGLVAEAVQWTYGLGPLIAGFIGGLLYSTFVTTPFAIAGFIDLGSTNALPVWQIALTGAIGATIADLVLVKGVRSPLAAILVRSVVGHDIEAFKSKRRTFLSRWGLGLFGGLLIATPLPTDELGVIFFSASGLNIRQMVPVILISDFVGIYGFVYLAQAIAGA